MKTKTKTNNKTTLMRVLVLVILLVAGVNKGAWAQNNRVSNVANGDWNVPATWSPIGVPLATDNVTIAAGHTITIPLNYNAVAKQVIINSSGNLTLAPGTASNSTLAIGGALVAPLSSVSTNFDNNGTFTAGFGSIVSFVNRGSAGGQSINGNVVFHHLVINQVNQADVVSLGTSNCTVNGDFTITNGVFDPKINNLTVTGATNIASGGTFTDTGNLGTNTFNGAVTVAGGGNFTQPIAANTSNYVFKSNIINNGMFDLQTSTAGTIDFSSASPPLVITANNPMNFGLVANANSDITLAAGTGGIVFTSLTVAASKTVINNNTSVNGTLVGFAGALGGAGTFVNNTLLVINNATIPMASGTLTANIPGNIVRYDANATGIKNITYHHLEINGTKTLQGATNVNGDFRILNAPSVTLTLATFDLNIKGNWTGGLSPNILTVTSTTGKVNFNGTAAQTINGFTNFSNLEINKIGATPIVTLNNSITVANELTLTAGRIVLGSNNLILNTVFASTSSAGWVDTSTGLGAFINNSTATSSIIFPVGDASVKRIANLVTTSSIAGTSVRFVSTPPPTPIGSTNVASGIWVITSTGTGINTVELRNVGIIAPNIASRIHTSIGTPIAGTWTALTTTTSGLGFSATLITQPTTSTNFTVFTPLATNDYFSTGTTSDWNFGTTWSNNASGIPACGCTPADNPGTANVTIRTGTTVNLNVPANIATLTIGGTLNTSNNLTVNAVTNISSSGIFDDKSLPSPTPIYTFDLLNITSGTFQKTVANNSTYNFNGNITNNSGTFNLNVGSGNNSFWNLGNPVAPIAAITVTNNSNNDMRFNNPVSGLGAIVGNVIIANTTFSGNVYLHGNGSGVGYITIDAGKTLTNDLGINGTATGRRLIASPRNSGGIGATFINTGVVEIAVGAGTAEPVYNFSNTTSLVVFRDGASVISTITATPNSFYNDISIAGTGTSTLLGNIIVNRNLTINNVSTLSAINGANNFNINIKGNWVKNGTGAFNQGTGTVTFDGASAQTITGNTTFHNIMLSNTSTTGITVASGTNLIVIGNWNTTASFFTPDVVGGNNVITFGGSSVQTISAGLSGTSFNNLKINSSSQVTLNSGIFIAKDLTNDGTFNGVGFQVGFLNTNTNQNILGGGTTTFGNLFINKTGTVQTVTLGQAITVTNALTLTNGRIVLGANNLTYNGNDANLSGANGWIETNLGGAFIRSTPAISGSSSFPVGDGGAKRNVNFAFVASPTFTNPTSVRFIPTITPALIGATNVAVGMWEIKGAGTSNIEFNNSGATLATSKIHTSNGTTAWQILTTGTPTLTPPTSFPTNGFTQTITGTNFTIFTPAPTSNTFYSNTPSGGNWNVAGSWSSAPSVPMTTTVPTANAIIIIQDGHTINVATSTDILAGADIDVQGGGVLQFNANNTNQITTITSTIPNTSGTRGKLVFNDFVGNIDNGINNLFASTAGTTIEYAGTNAMNVQAGFGPSTPPVYQNLIISGSGVKTIINATNIEGNLTIASGATFSNANDKNINIKGDWTRIGAFISGIGTATVTFNGANAQTITGNTTFNNLTIDNSANVTANNNITVNNTLTLTNGKLIIGNNELTISNAVSGTSFNVAKCIELGATGKVIRLGASITAGNLFPIGTATSYNPITISSLSTSGSIGVRLRLETATEVAPFLTSERVKYLWTIDAGTTANALVKFEWGTPDANITPSNTNVKMQRLTGATWIPETGSTFAPPSASISATNVSLNGLSVFSVFGVPIPVVALAVPSTDIKFLPISANNANNKVTFSWQAVSNPNPIGYEVRIGTIEANILVWKTAIPVPVAMLSYTNNNIEYDVTTYYSVRAIGATAALNSAWSAFVNIFVSSINDPTTSLNNDINNQITISPNPSSDAFVIDNKNSVAENISFVLTDAVGKTILTSSTTNGFPYKMNIEGVASGLYYLKISPVTPKGRQNTFVVKKIVKK